ncbi:MAG: hypothetical protein H6Q14_148 [Bacteroidetes bacterium]|nr:hypothetical protein [Bacteroidota bacterium]
MKIYAHKTKNKFDEIKNPLDKLDLKNTRTKLMDCICAMLWRVYN